MPTNHKKIRTVAGVLDVVKEFRAFGPLQLFRLAKVHTFTCDRCKRKKTSKLVVNKNGDWSTLICNGCYGWLRSRQTTKY